MDAKEYLIKVTQICEAYGVEGCMDGSCPLTEYLCGAPLELEKIEEVLKIVETTELKNHSIEEQSESRG